MTPAPPRDAHITVLSEPHAVSMGAEWFEIANLEHFWIRRRYEVLAKLAGDQLNPDVRLAEVGCGHGLLQRQLEDDLHVTVDGYDLDQQSMSRSASRHSNLYCYDIFDRRPELKSKYDGLFLFDVIEHVPDDAAFLACAAEHVKPGGRLFVNVPALQSCFSAYDKAVGHLRRYSRRSLQQAAVGAGLTVERDTYWGFALVPLLWWRKLTLRSGQPEQIINRGMAPPGRLANRALLTLSRVERCPQQLAGASLMAVLRKT